MEDLGERLPFRHLVRHLYADGLDPPQVARLLDAFEGWLAELASAG